MVSLVLGLIGAFLISGSAVTYRINNQNQKNRDEVTNFFLKLVLFLSQTETLLIISRALFVVLKTPVRWKAQSFLSSRRVCGMPGVFRDDDDVPGEFEDAAVFKKITW